MLINFRNGEMLLLLFVLTGNFYAKHWKLNILYYSYSVHFKKVTMVFRMDYKIVFCTFSFNHFTVFQFYQPWIIYICSFEYYVLFKCCYISLCFIGFVHNNKNYLFYYGWYAKYLGKNKDNRFYEICMLTILRD